MGMFGTIPVLGLLHDPLQLQGSHITVFFALETAAKRGTSKVWLPV